MSGADICAERIEFFISVIGFKQNIASPPKLPFHAPKRRAHLGRTLSHNARFLFIRSLGKRGDTCDWLSGTCQDHLFAAQACGNEFRQARLGFADIHMDCHALAK
jgi:hypothetical protein